SATGHSTASCGNGEVGPAVPAAPTAGTAGPTWGDAMTEAEWLACDDPYRMLRLVRGGLSDRKVRLFGCACIRRVWHLNRDERLGPILLAVEDFADGLITIDEMRPLYLLAADIGDGDDDQCPDAPSGFIALELMIASVVPLGYPYSYHGPG